MWVKKWQTIQHLLLYIYVARALVRYLKGFDRDHKESVSFLKANVKLHKDDVLTRKA